MLGVVLPVVLLVLLVLVLLVEVPRARQNQEGLNAMWFPIFVQVNFNTAALAQ